MKRTHTRKRKDKRVFNQTANQTKSLNVNNTTYRGGIRL